MNPSLFERHSATLHAALEAIRTRGYWSAYPEVPSGKVYGETAKDDGLAAFQKRLNSSFAIDQPSTGKSLGSEVSPYGMKLGITYPQIDPETLIPAAKHAMTSWSRASVEQRVGVCLEILHQLNRRSFELAYAVMHTTGQGFMMAFQAGGPHAQDRGLEAVAYAYDEMTRVPREVAWTKQVSKTDQVRLSKQYRLSARGVGVVIGCSTFPTWNSYPGLFASLSTGNAVIVKPHPGAILPLAITVEIARNVLREQGFDPNLVTLAVDTRGKPLGKKLVTHPDVRLVDYTGGSAFGQWIEKNATQAAVFTEKAGVNSAIIDSVEDFQPVAANLAFTLSLYSGQMCTTTQNIFVPRTGIRTAAGQMSFDDVCRALIDALNGFLSDPKRAAEVLGAIQNDVTADRVDHAAKDGGVVLRASEPVQNDLFPKARMRSPLVLKVDARDTNIYMREMFGPIAYIVQTDSTSHSIELARQCAVEHGAITWSLYATDPKVIQAAEDAAFETGTALSTNLTGQIFVNQAAAFSDFHVSGQNPSGNATLCDAGFVASRFRIVQSRIPAPAATNKPPATAAQAVAAASV